MLGDRLENHVWQKEQDSFNSRMSERGITPSISLADKRGICMLAHAGFDAFEGEFSPAPFLMLNLCTAHVGRIKRVGEGPKLEGVLRPGTVAIALPGTAASGHSSKTQLLGIAINLEALWASDDNAIAVDALIPAASQLHNDPFLSAVMSALWRDAELHGLSSAFFEEGINVLLRRLSQCPQSSHRQQSTHPLKGPRLQNVLELIESRLAEDIRVSELAALAGQDSRSFTRSFSAATGFTPFAYITQRRMRSAKESLRNQSLSITDIALSVGYSNPSKFSEAFRRISGITPGQWRKVNDL